MKQFLFMVIATLLAAGCGAPFDINPAPAAQVRIACYDGTVIKRGHTLTAVFPDLSDNQKASLRITYTWYRNEAAISLRSGDEHPQSDSDPLYTVKEEDLGADIKVRAVFKYRETESVSYAVANISTIDVSTFSELKTALANAVNASAAKITTIGDFSITEDISISQNVTITLNTALSAQAHITIQGEVIVSAGRLTIAPAKNVNLVTGGTFTVQSGGMVNIEGTLWNNSGTVLNNGTITLESGAVLAQKPVFAAGENGTYLVKQGARVSGFIAPGAIIDNSAASELSLTRGGTELVTGAVTVIDDWALADTLTVSGTVTVAPGKTLSGAGSQAKLVLKPGALVSGGAADLNLSEGTYTWDAAGEAWQ
ncbi:MAG: hypothetical protein LBR16_01380 [Treponema sp.]|jgi:hypothetical protein|nr:hypothetical protein [Treponema sp.]